MDPIVKPDIEKLREKVYKDLWDITRHAIVKDELTTEEGGKIADFILERLDDLQTEPELLSFLRKLAEQWSMFSNEYLLIQSEVDNEAKLESLKAQLHQE